MVRFALALSLSLLLSVACRSSADMADTAREPAGTPTDPVEVCKRVADVCRLEGAKLGVCIAPAPGTTPAACAGRAPCFLCVSQH